MKSLNKVEMASLLKVAESSPKDLLMILLAFNHGLRVSEVIGLTHANFKDGYLTVQRLKGSCKTSQKLLANEAELLAQHMPASGLLFPICRRTAWLRIKKLGTAAGIESIKCFPHVLKHTTAMLGLQGGMKINELQTYLGHKSGASTMAYLKVSDDEACNAFAAAMGG